MKPSKSLLNQFCSIVGPKNALGGEHDLTHYTHENRGYVIGETALVLKPDSTDQVAAILKLANDTGTVIVPQGGHTGHAGGGVPLPGKDSVVVSLERMNKVLEIDTKANTLTVEAGVILEHIQNLAADHDRLFPLSLGAQGSCMIGGNISTNAGGTGVLAYGNTRDLVLGLEVVLADGTVWSSLNKLRKNNTGYDLKNLFVGAEGTLGIITAAVVKLFPAPKGREVAWAGFNSTQQALDFLDLAKNLAGNQLTAFELVPRRGIEFLGRHIDGVQDPLTDQHCWYGLIEISSLRSDTDARQLTEEIFAAGLEQGLMDDAVLASSLAQQKLFWKMREELPLSQRPEGASIAHDISVPISRVPELVERGEELVKAIVPDVRMMAFGHLGDGNIHFNFTSPKGMSREEYMAYRPQVNQVVYDLVLELDGSISAEHGIGLFKLDLMKKTKPAIELDMMRRVKSVLDPNNIMNPGKVIPD